MLPLDYAFLIGMILAIIISGLASLSYLLPQPGKLKNKRKREQ